MANDNRKPPHKHDPELARKEARPRTVLPHHAEKPSRKIPDISKYVVRK